jgi:transposase
VERVERLMTIPAAGPITALTWALEAGDVRRFSSIKKNLGWGAVDPGASPWLHVQHNPSRGL